MKHAGIPEDKKCIGYYLLLSLSLNCSAGYNCSKAHWEILFDLHLAIQSCDWRFFFLHALYTWTLIKEIMWFSLVLLACKTEGEKYANTYGGRTVKSQVVDRNILLTRGEEMKKYKHWDDSNRDEVSWEAVWQQTVEAIVIFICPYVLKQNRLSCWNISCKFHVLDFKKCHMF